MTVLLRFLLNGSYQLTQIDDSGHLLSQEHTNQLSDITIPTHSPCIICLPGTQISMHEVILPKMNKQEIQLAVPNLLEDRLPVPTETCYFAIGEPNTENLRHVAVINKARWQQTLDQLAEHEIHPQQIIPDYLALPLTEDDWAIVFEEDLTLVRTGLETGFTIETEMVNEMMARALSQATTQPEDIVNITDPNIQQPTVDAPVSVIHEPGIWGSGTTSFNMLNKPISTPRTRSTLSSWQWCGLSAIGLIILLFIGQLALLINTHLQLNALDKKILQAAKTLSPQIDRVEQTRTIIDRIVRSYQVDPNPFLTTFDQFAQAKQQFPTITLNGFEFNQGKIKLSLTSRSTNNLNNLYQALIKHGVTVTQNQTQPTQGNMISQTLVLGGQS